MMRKCVYNINKKKLIIFLKCRRCPSGLNSGVINESELELIIQTYLSVQFF